MREPAAPGALAGAARDESPWTPLWLALVLVLALAVRLPGLTEPWSGKGFNAGLGAWGTGEFARNFAQNGFAEAGFMPYRWRIELPDGTVEREWYAHHPAAFALLSSGCFVLFGGGEWTIRLPWLLFSLGAVWALYRFLVLVWGERVALLGAFALAVLPLAAHYSLLPWVDTNAMPFVYALFLRRYVLWLRAPGPATLKACALYAFVGGLLDWNMAFLLAPALVHAVVCALRDGRGWRGLLPLAWIPAGFGAAVLVHATHMLLVMPWDAMASDTGTTLGRTTTTATPWSTFFANQWQHASRTLTPAAAWLCVLGLLRQVYLGARGRLGREEWLWPVLLLPGLLYPAAFPFRGANHDFMIALALPWFGATLGLELAFLGRLAGRAPRRRAFVTLVLAAVLGGLGVQRTLAMWRETRSDAVARVAREDWFTQRFSDPRAVGVTSRGQTWMLLYYSAAPIVPRITTVAQLEGLRARVLSKLEPDRPIYFLFDRQFQDVERELLEYLRSSGPSEEHLEYLQADPLLAFEVFDLRTWAHAGD